MLGKNLSLGYSLSNNYFGALHLKSLTKVECVDEARKSLEVTIRCSHTA